MTPASIPSVDAAGNGVPPSGPVEPPETRGRPESGNSSVLANRVRAKPLFGLRERKQCLRIMKAIRLPGTLRELLMLIRRFSMWKAKTGSRALLNREPFGDRNRLLEGATGGDGIDQPGFDISRNRLPQLEAGLAGTSNPSVVAPGVCLGG